MTPSCLFLVNGRVVAFLTAVGEKEWKKWKFSGIIMIFILDKQVQLLQKISMELILMIPKLISKGKGVT